MDDSAIAYDEQGLVPCVIQDWRSGEVLTLAYMNAESLAATRRTGELHLWSRSRAELWHKGATSGNTQAVRAIRYDCDGDALLALVELAGPACHTGARTCFHRGELEPQAPLEELPALAAEHNLVPVRQTFLEDCETPVSAFLKLRGAGPAFLLESAEQGQRVGRWSFIGYRPRHVVRWNLEDGGDPYALAAAEVERHRQAPLPGLPPFAGGAVGFFGYDCVRAVESLPAPNPDPVGLPDLALMLTDALVAFDHLKHTVTILANAYVGEEGVEAGYDRARRVIADVRERLTGPLPRLAGAAGTEPSFEPNMPREAFEAMVARIVEYVHAGDAFQVVPSQRWSAEVDVDAFSIYRGLRAINPSPYMYFLDFEDFQIVGASPEPLVTVTGGRATTRPIAGTRPRGGDAEEDQAIAQDLLADEKERAEHVMLVDLGRNDLGRVCEYGSVEVETFMAVETYSHLIHIVSQVGGRLRREVGPMDALRSILPAGTLSGAPKVRAMQIIDELEPVKRGAYGGAVGYLSYTGEP